MIAPATADANIALGVPSVEVWPLIAALESVATSELTVTLKREYLTVPSAAVTLTIKKSPFATAVVALLAKAVSVSNPEVGAPVAYLTILVIAAPASVLVKTVARPPVA